MISILLPTFNAASNLEWSVRSILDQTFQEFELLVLDDGSTDETGTVMANFRDPRIEYRRYPHRGIAETLNAGLTEAKFEIIARMDAGDYALKERLERQYRYISTSPHNTILASQYAVHTGNKLKYVVGGQPDDAAIKRRLALHPDFAHSSVMYFKHFILSSGSYRNIPLEDYDLWLRINRTAQFHILPEVLVIVEYEAGHLSTTNVQEKYGASYHLQRQYYNDLQGHFGIEDDIEQTVYRGWREYFFGDKIKARSYWRSAGFLFLTYPRVILAYLMTFLPGALFLRFKEYRLRFRVRYLLSFWSKENRTLRAAYRDSREGLL